MSFRTKFDKISAKMGFVMFISALWFLFWIVSGWKDGSFLEGLAFGGVPVVLIWGFWLLSIRSDKEVDLKEETPIVGAINHSARGQWGQAAKPDVRTFPH